MIQRDRVHGVTVASLGARAARACLAAVLAVCCAPTLPAQGRAALADVELEGPLGDVVFDLGPSGRTVVHGGLRAGERVRLLVPMATRAPEDRRIPTIHALAEASAEDITATPAEVQARARFLGWRDEPLVTSAGDARMPAALRARPRPPIVDERRALPRSILGLVGVGFLLACALRRRPLVVLLLGGATSGVVLWLVPRLVPPPEMSPSVVDGDRDQATWVWRRGARSEIRLEGHDQDREVFDLEVEPAGTAVEWRVAVREPASYLARASGAELWIVRPTPAIPWILDPATGVPGGFRRAWIRTEGEWNDLGAWEPGRAPPDPSGHHGPPGWLASGLPQGVSVLVGEEAGHGEGQAYVRVTGW